MYSPSNLKLKNQCADIQRLSRLQHCRDCETKVESGVSVLARDQLWGQESEAKEFSTEIGSKHKYLVCRVTANHSIAQSQIFGSSPREPYHQAYERWYPNMPNTSAFLQSVPKMSISYRYYKDLSGLPDKLMLSFCCVEFESISCEYRDRQ